jgi:Protein of unknown function (DUF2458)
MKVYKAQLEMNRQMSSRLRECGVPFFGTKSELVRSRAQAGAGRMEDPKTNGMIEESELLKLQRKMLSILEDLCSD